MLAEIAQRHALGQLVLDELARRLREQGLAAVRGRTDARGPRHVEPEVAVAGDLWLPRVQPHSSAYRAGEPALCIGRRSNGIARARERDEEGLRLAIDDDTAVRGDGIEQDAFVFGDRRAVIATELLLQPRRAFDVGEEKGHGPFR